MIYYLSTAPEAARRLAHGRRLLAMLAGPLLNVPQITQKRRTAAHPTNIPACQTGSALVQWGPLQNTQRMLYIVK